MGTWIEILFGLGDEVSYSRRALMGTWIEILGL